MNPLEQKILAAFDSSGGCELSLDNLGEPAAVRAAATRLVEQGFLRPGADGTLFMRTEQGRLQLARPSDVTIYSRPGCRLCEEAKLQIMPLVAEFGARLTEINIDEDAALRSLYDFEVPVIFLGSRKAAKHRVDIAQFRRQLRDAK